MKKLLFILINAIFLTAGMGFNASAQVPPRHTEHHGVPTHHPYAHPHKSHHSFDRYNHYGPMDASTFDDVCERIKKAGWANGEHYDVISKSLAHGYIFSSAQTVYLLKLFGSYYEKEKVALMIYPTVYDPQNWYQVYDAFKNHYWRDDLRQKIRAIDANRSE